MDIYLEGDPALRKPMEQFIRNAVGSPMSIKVIPCGPRERAMARFGRGQTDSLLLVDSEGEDLGELTARISQRTAADSMQMFYMVQLMEAWFLADRALLAGYYGRGFNADALPSNPAIEAVPKRDVLDGLRNATRACGKGAYRKGSDAPVLLRGLNHAAVAAVCPNFERLVDFLRRGPQRA